MNIRRELDSRPRYPVKAFDGIIVSSWRVYAVFFFSFSRIHLAKLNTFCCEFVKIYFHLALAGNEPGLLQGGSRPDSIPDERRFDERPRACSHCSSAHPVDITRGWFYGAGERGETYGPGSHSSAARASASRSKSSVS